MALKEPDFELLRPGVLLSEKFKLLERIPRWIAGRRFLADSSGKRVQLLFFEEAAGEKIDHWKENLRSIQQLNNKALLPVLSIEYLRGFNFLVAEEVRGPCMRTLLDEEGVIAPEDARDILFSLRDALRAMRHAGLDAPAIIPETILLVESDNALRPVLFPWGLSSYPSTPSGEVSLRLRDLLYTATTNLQAPDSYAPRDLLALPPPIRRHWQAVFENTPDWAALDEWAPSSLRAQLPPERPGIIPSSPNQQTRSPGMQRAISPQPQAARPLPANVNQPRTSNAWPVISTVASLAAAAAVVWFSYTLVESLRSPTYLQQQTGDFSFPSSIGFPPQTTTQSLVPTAPKLPVPGNAPLEDEGPLVHEGAERPSSTHNLEIPPSDPSGEPGTNLMLWYGRWQSQRDNAELTAQFSDYLLGLTSHADAIRTGRMPALLKELENVVADSPPAAAYLLGKILWGRETHRAEHLMKKIAREGYEPARVWCDEQLIDWQ